MNKTVGLAAIVVVLIGVGLVLYIRENTYDDTPAFRSGSPRDGLPVSEEIASPEVPEDETPLNPADSHAGISGRVSVVETDSPVAEALATLSWKENGEERRLRTVTDAEGAFHFEQNAVGAYRLEFSHPEYISEHERYAAVIQQRQTSASIRIEMISAGIVSGRVYDAQTREGIAGVKVGIGRKLNPVGLTDESGNYRLRGVPDGDKRVFHEGAKGYLFPPTHRNGISISVAPGRTLEDVDIPLQPGVFAAISGVVVDESGVPVSHASVTVFRPDDLFMGSEPVEDRTGRDGAFALADLEVNDGYHIVAGIEGSMWESPAPISVPAEGIADLRITLRPAASVSGRVVDHSGNPVSDSEISVSMTGRFRGSNSAGFHATPLGENGTFRIDGLNAGTYGLVVLSQMQMRSTGIIVPQATVEVDNGEHLEDITLRYDYAAHIAGKRRFEQQQSAAAGPTPRQTEFEIDGQVVSAATGEPVRNFTLRIAGSSNFLKPIHDEQGRFSVMKREGSELSIRFESKGYVPSTIDVEDRMAGTPLVVRLGPGAAANGVVVDAFGAPVAGAAIYIGSDPSLMDHTSLVTGGGSEVAVSLADGSFRLDTLPESPETIYATHPSYAMGSVTIVPSLSNPTTARIVLRAGGAVEGRVFENGRGIGGRSIMVLNADGQNVQMPRSASDTSGAYRYEHLAPGVYTFYTSASDDWHSRRTQYREAEIVEGVVTVVDFDFSRPSGILEGWVRVNGLPARGNVRAEVVSAFAKDRLNTQVARDGAYVLENLPAGVATVTVSVVAEDGARYQDTVNVPLTEGVVNRHDFDLGSAE